MINNPTPATNNRASAAFTLGRPPAGAGRPPTGALAEKDVPSANTVRGWGVTSVFPPQHVRTNTHSHPDTDARVPTGTNYNTGVPSVFYVQLRRQEGARWYLHNRAGV